MSVIFNPTAEETRALEALIAAIPGIQDKLVVNHRLLTRPDRSPRAGTRARWTSGQCR